MCGIVGYVGPRDAAPILLEGLRRLEYRGYDSAGHRRRHPDGEVFVEKKAGKLTNLTDQLNGSAPAGHPGHRPHPLGDARPARTTRTRIRTPTAPATWRSSTTGSSRTTPRSSGASPPLGHRFTSETDTEVLAHLIETKYRGDLVEAVRAALNEVRGAYAIGVMHTDHPGPDRRRADERAAHRGPRRRARASSPATCPAILEHTKNVVILHEGDIADVTPDGTRIISLDGTEMQRDVTEIHWNIEAAEKGGFAHFTLKEIYEQPHAIQESPPRPHRPRRRRDPHRAGRDRGQAAQRVERVYVVGCGTASYAAHVARVPHPGLGRPAGDHAGRLGDALQPCRRSTSGRSSSASASRARRPTRSRPLKLAEERGATVVVVTNVVGSAITREADAVCYLQAGPEIAVASTKAFVTQVLVLQMIALHLARLRGTPHREPAADVRPGAAQPPAPRGRDAAPGAADQEAGAAVRARRATSSSSGAASGFPIAMEGALKLKELSYVHAEGYAAGELKHGPIALLDADTPLVAIATAGAVYEKVVSNVAEARARSAPIIAIATEGDDQIDHYAHDVIYVPETPEPISPVIAVLPLQLLAYEMAVARGTDVDQPRNLAKSVTVE